jgi:phenylacetate-CoA ligase
VLASDVAHAVRREIERQNSEFLGYVPEGRRTPRVVLLPPAHPEYFPRGVKHRYTR